MLRISKEKALELLQIENIIGEDACFKALLDMKCIHEGLSWQTISDVMLQECKIKISARACARRGKKILQAPDFKLDEMPFSPNGIPHESDAFLKLKKERIKLSDERAQAATYIRSIARFETIQDTIKDFAEEVAKTKPLKRVTIKNRASEANHVKKEGILQLSDWHYGMEFENAWNAYSPDILKLRLNTLLEEIIMRCKQNGVEKLHLLNLGDLIAGRIHLTIRLESKETVIAQTMHVAELLAEFIQELTNHMWVEYHSCWDNHSRLEPNKVDSLDEETLCSIIDWYLQTRLKANNQVKFHSNAFGSDIITFECFGHNVLGVHGHKDKNSQVIDSISRMTHMHYDLICTAHLHHFSADEKNETIIVANGSLMGTDTYAANLRLSAKPSQNLIIATADNVVDTIYRIPVH